MHMSDLALAENNQLLKQLISANQSENKQVEIFSHMCERLSKSISQREILDERAIRDFTKMIIWLVRNDIKEFPPSFYKLKDMLSDYYLYSLDEENDSEIEYAYLRFYQLISVLQTQKDEQIKGAKVLAAVDQYKAYTFLLKIIRTTPGITYRQLEKECEISSDNLQEQINNLIQDKFLSTRRSGKGQFFFLTNLGEALCTSIEFYTRSCVSLDTWSTERTQVLCAFLEKLASKYPNQIPVLLALQTVAEFSDKEIAEVARSFRFKKKPLVQNTKSFSMDSAAITYNQYFYMPNSNGLIAQHMVGNLYRLTQPLRYENKVSQIDSADEFYPIEDIPTKRK